MKKMGLVLGFALVGLFSGLIGPVFGSAGLLSEVNRGKYDQCILRWSEEIARHPKEASAYNNRALCYFFSGKRDLARADLKNALRLAPENTVVRYNAAWMDLLSGRASQARKAFETLAEKAPQSAPVLSAAGLAYLTEGQAERALYFLAKAKEAGAESPWSLFHLAYAYHLSGEPSRAATYFSLVLKKKADFLRELEGRVSEADKSALHRLYLREAAAAAKYLTLPDTLLARLKMEGPKTKTIAKTEPSPAEIETALEIPAGACVPVYPNRYLLAVLVSSYDELPEISFVKNDRKLIFKLATCFLGVPKKHILVLEEPTLAQFRRKSREFLSGVRKRDAVVFFYYSGHGVTDGKGRFYLLPRDASVKTEADLRETALSLSELEKKLALARGMKLALLDACRVRVPWKPAVLVTEKVQRKDLAVVFATARGKMSVAERSGRASAFLVALYRMASRGIENLDFDGSGYVELSELEKSLIVQVKKASGGSQKPEVMGVKNIPVFPVE